MDDLLTAADRVEGAEPDSVDYVFSRDPEHVEQSPMRRVVGDHEAVNEVGEIGDDGFVRYSVTDRLRMVHVPTEVAESIVYDVLIEAFRARADALGWPEQMDEDEASTAIRASIEALPAVT